jgi:glucose-1-phosphate thymidylyltransferase
MNALILAAGYATRLYPLTLNQAKPLLLVGGKPIIERVVAHLLPITDLKTFYIVTNHKFAQQFMDWTGDYRQRNKSARFEVLDDGSTSDADKLGAIGDIFFAVEQKNIYSEDLLVVAGDNLFSESLANFADFAREHPATIGVYDVEGLEEAKKYNQLTTNPAGIVTEFIEKPTHPSSTLCGIALYYYSPEALRLLKTYLAEGNNPDQPGRFVQWLYKRIDIFTYPIDGLWYDIGSHESLAEANEVFSGR